MGAFAETVKLLLVKVIPGTASAGFHVTVGTVATSEIGNTNGDPETPAPDTVATILRLYVRAPSEPVASTS